LTQGTRRSTQSTIGS